MATVGTPRRIDVLSLPKPVPPGFLEDRRSLYWVDRVPPQSGEGGTSAVASSRVLELSRSKAIHPSYKWDRPTPIWGVSAAAQQTQPSDRVEYLSQSKELSPLHKPERSPYMLVGFGARKAKTTPRLDTLATPKEREDHWTTQETYWGQTQPVSQSAMRAETTPRVAQLSEFKDLHPLYKVVRTVQWPVSESALKAIASLRLQQMARPRSRTMIKDDYDPYRVSFAARHARPTPRVEELCMPFPRKVRAKNV